MTIEIILVDLLFFKVRPGPVIMHLVPALISQPITPFFSRSLSSLADVYGPSIDFHIHTIMPWFLNGIANNEDESIRRELLEAASDFVLHIHEDAARSLIQTYFSCRLLNFLYFF
jgi:hypothetical protein